MPLMESLKLIGQLVPLIYSIGTTIRRAIREIDADDGQLEIVYVILDAVEGVCRDIRDALPPRPPHVASAPPRPQLGGR